MNKRMISRLRQEGIRIPDERETSSGQIAPRAEVTLHYTPPALGRHGRKCTICRHEEREAIEEEFLNWHSPYTISLVYSVPERSIYNHAHAVGLYQRRRLNLRSALELIIERAECAKVTAHSIVHAVRAYTRLTDDGRWIEPPTQVIFASVPARSGESVPSDPPATMDSPRNLIDGGGH